MLRVITDLINMAQMSNVTFTALCSVLIVSTRRIIGDVAVIRKPIDALPCIGIVRLAGAEVRRRRKKKAVDKS